MSDNAGPVLLSVRGEARQTVAPDSAVLRATITSTQGSKTEALRAAAVALDGLTADLAVRGGSALDASTGRHALTWSAQSATTYAEHAHNRDTGDYEPTGRVTAEVAVVITVRDFGLLAGLDADLAAHDTVAVHQVTWHVDGNNPAWPDVRAAAIQAAIAKGRDYAAALGGFLRTVEHVADAGFLSGTAAEGGLRATAAALAGGGGGGPETPSLDPVPQDLVAVVEARLTADGVSLTAQ
jgi:uncharacterized protein YggE